MLDRLLFRQLDNSPLLVFRMFFGILISLECYGAIFTGWVRRNLVEPEFTFAFIGFEWLQPLPGVGMYLYFIVVGTLGIWIALGYRYRFSMIAFTLLWTAVYLMQKTAYNNHYYLLALISAIMCFLPAHVDYSLDARRDPSIRRNFMFSYVKWLIVGQLFIMYTYAAIAKMYGDWLDFSFLGILFKGKADYPLIGGLLQEVWLHKAVGVLGILFDLLIVPALLWKPSRNWAFIASIFFHLFNSIVFQIGIFPYLSLAFTVFFFEPEMVRKVFFKGRGPFLERKGAYPSCKKWITGIMAIYLLLQLILPVRHFFIKDDVLWTEEGHRMSWRMMLRNRNGMISFRVMDKETGEVNTVDLDAYLTKAQINKIGAYPDFIWQFAQRLKKEYANRDQDISVFVDCKVAINGKPFYTFIDPNADLAAEPWDYFWHNEWIFPSPLKD